MTPELHDALGLLLLAAVLAVTVWHFATRRRRRRARVLAQPFPAEWEAVLQRDVVFFRALPPGQQQRFRQDLQIFLDETRITGVGTEVDVTTRVLAGASAIIPVFGHPEWEWREISEILVRPGRFDMDPTSQRGSTNVLGMVGTGVMDGVMILSKPDLLRGFRNPSDKQNVGLHEFAHLVDKSDGRIDGIPAIGLDREAVGPWVELVRRKMQEIREGDSDLRDYALTNEAEFFAVATEAFFERPDTMQVRHPELYAAMERIFRPGFADRLREFARERGRRPKKFGRNSPCPCGSGRKFKKCCLR
jgi:Mlc titration factor MtfA (ptsG expression regulator)